MRVLISLFIFSILLFTSCKTRQPGYQKFLQDVTDTVIRDSLYNLQPVIQKGDLLSIRVYSLASGGVNAQADAPYNVPELEGAGNTVPRGIMVDQAGNIEYPQIGLVHAEGLTREQLAEVIREKLENHLDKPTVVVRYMNYKITVLGEVGSPSTFTVPTERVTILEALGFAGDITEFGRKDNVKIVRETNGNIEVGEIDLTSKDMFTSPFFKLQQNDVVMVEQNRRKITQDERRETLQQVGIVTTIITGIALILNFFK